MAYRISSRIDKATELGLRSFAMENGLTRSQAVRELLRQGLGRAEPVERGWHEGFSMGYADHQKALAGIEVQAPKRRPPWMTAKR